MANQNTPFHLLLLRFPLCHILQPTVAQPVSIACFVVGQVRCNHLDILQIFSLFESLTDFQFKISSPFPECTASTSHPHLYPLVSHLSEPGPPFHPFSVGLRGQSSCSSSLKCDQQPPPMQQRLPMLEKHQTVKKKNEVTFLLTTTTPSIRKCCYIEKNASLVFLGPLQLFRRPWA